MSVQQSAVNHGCDDGADHGGYQQPRAPPGVVQTQSEEDAVDEQTQADDDSSDDVPLRPDWRVAIEAAIYVPLRHECRSLGAVDIIGGRCIRILGWLDQRAMHV